ncbi:MAG: glycosyltransferase family 2 protein [Pasteurella multocida]|nr:glycosyltransferase family 2 protein [Pasteurella multocida]
MYTSIFSPLISVLICAYNSEKYIERSIRSVMNQTYKNLEIIIINDGSSDNTFNIIERLSREDSRIRVINNDKNIGLISSLNIGIDNFNGEYLARIDSDDFAKPQWIEKLFTFLDENKDIVLVGSYLEIFSEDENGSILSFDCKNGDIWRYPTDDCEIRERMFFHNPIAHPTVLIRAEIFTKKGFKYSLDYKYAEDYKLWLEISRVGKLANYPEALVYYRFHSEQVSSKNNLEQIKITKKIRREAINYYFNDLGVKQKVEEKMDFSLISKIQSELILMKSKSPMTVYFLYELWMSLDNITFKEIFIFTFRESGFFEFKLRIKLLKNFLNLKKYESII